MDYNTFIKSLIRKHVINLRKLDTIKSQNNLYILSKTVCSIDKSNIKEQHKEVRLWAKYVAECKIHNFSVKLKWCQNNVTGQYKVLYLTGKFTVAFANKTDATLFKMVWC